MATYKNLRYCQILHDGSYYDVLIAVNNLDEVDDILQEWAMAHSDIGEPLDLPSELVKNIEAKDVNLKTISLDTSVYVKSQSTGYLDNPQFGGIVTTPVLPDTLVGGNYVVPSGGVANLWSGTDFSGFFGSYNVATTNLIPVANSVNTLCVSYNNGSPVYVFGTPNFSSIVPVADVLYFGSDIYNVPYGNVNSLATKLLQNTFKRERAKIISDIEVTLSDLEIEIPEMTVNVGVNDIVIPEFDSTDSGHEIYLAYKDGSNEWVTASASGVNNFQYQGSGTGIQTLTDAYYNINYIFRLLSNETIVFTVLSNQFETIAEAKASKMIEIPDFIKNNAVLVGRAIAQKSVSTPIIQQIQTVSFAD